MKTKLSLVILASMFAVGAHAGDLTVNNTSVDAIAAGGDSKTEIYGGGKANVWSGRAIAGSVVLDNACDCLRHGNVKISNNSNGAIAVGRAVAGSVVLTQDGGNSW